MNKLERLIELGHEDIIIFKDESYTDAIIGISHDNRAIYDYNKMVEYLVAHENITEEQAKEWIDYNTIRALPYVENSPIIMYALEEE